MIGAASDSSESGGEPNSTPKPDLNIGILRGWLSSESSSPVNNVQGVRNNQNKIKNYLTDRQRRKKWDRVKQYKKILLQYK